MKFKQEGCQRILISHRPKKMKKGTSVSRILI